MRFSPTIVLSAAAAAAAAAEACTKPTTKPVIDNSRPFGIKIQNKSYPAIHNRNMNLWAAGGGDEHLYLSPAGTETQNLQYFESAITQGTIHTVINGEYTPEDNTTKMFMTERGDPKALFEVIYGCNPDDDALQLELRLAGRGTAPVTTSGGHICVRSASQDRYEFRYSPPGNDDKALSGAPGRPCMPITMALCASGRQAC